MLVLFLLPMMTMRTYSEEKRSGTIELLLTSPVTDFEIIIGKFLGAVGLYAGAPGVTLLYIGVLFVYGNPEWKPLVAGYLGLLLMGSCFISIGLFISSTTKNQMVAGVGDVRRRAALLDHQLDGRQRGPDGVGRSCRICRSPSTSTTSRRASSTPKHVDLLPELSSRSGCS